VVFMLPLFSVVKYLILVNGAWRVIQLSLNIEHLVDYISYLHFVLTRFSLYAIGSGTFSSCVYLPTFTFKNFNFVDV